MGCDGRYADADDYAAFWCVNIGDEGNEEATVNQYLEIAAADIHAALAATGACDCTLAMWADTLLKKLNVVDAAIFHECPCAKPRISDERKQALLDWMNLQLELIRTGKLELCAGETGSEFPYSAAAELGTTEFAQIEIVLNDILRGS